MPPATEPCCVLISIHPAGIKINDLHHHIVMLKYNDNKMSRYQIVIMIRSCHIPWMMTTHSILGM